jgi:hypothetical protein
MDNPTVPETLELPLPFAEDLGPFDGNAYALGFQQRVELGLRGPLTVDDVLRLQSRMELDKHLLKIEESCDGDLFRLRLKYRDAGKYHAEYFYVRRPTSGEDALERLQALALCYYGPWPGEPTCPNDSLENIRRYCQALAEWHTRRRSRLAWFAMGFHGADLDSLEGASNE